MTILMEKSTKWKATNLTPPRNQVTGLKLESKMQELFFNKTLASSWNNLRFLIIPSLLIVSKMKTLAFIDI
jgi:hypothetical protein